MMRYAILFEIDFGQTEYVRTTNPFHELSPVLLFDNLEDAKRESSNWNTGVAVVWDRGDADESDG